MMNRLIRFEIFIIASSRKRHKRRDNFRKFDKTKFVVAIALFLSNSNYFSAYFRVRQAVFPALAKARTANGDYKYADNSSTNLAIGPRRHYQVQICPLASETWAIN